MKKLLLVLSFFILLFSPFYSQEMKFELEENLELKLNFNEKKFVIQKVFIDGGGEGSDIISAYSQMECSGDIIINESLMKCVDKNRKKEFCLKKLKDYVYIAVSADRYLKKNKIIYASSYLSKDKSLSISMKWKNGKRDGEWLYVDLKNDITYVITYKNDILINKRNIEKEKPSWKIIK